MLTFKFFVLFNSVPSRTLIFGKKEELQSFFGQIAHSASRLISDNCLLNYIEYNGSTLSRLMNSLQLRQLWLKEKLTSLLMIWNSFFVRNVLFLNLVKSPSHV